MTKAYIVTFDIIVYADSPDKAVEAGRGAVKRHMEGSASAILEDA